MRSKVLSPSTYKTWTYQSKHEQLATEACELVRLLKTKKQAYHDIFSKEAKRIAQHLSTLTVGLQIGFFPESKKAFYEIKKAPETVIDSLMKLLQGYSLETLKEIGEMAQILPNLKKIKALSKEAFTLQEKHLDRLPVPSLQEVQKKTLLKNFNLWVKVFISQLLAEIFSTKDANPMEENLEKLMDDLAFHYIRFSSEALDLSRKNLLEEKNIEFYKKTFVRTARCFSCSRLKDASSLKKIDTFTRRFVSSENSEETLSFVKKISFAFFLDSILRSKPHKNSLLVEKTKLFPLLKEDSLSSENCAPLIDHFLEAFLPSKPLFSKDKDLIYFYMVKKEILENLLPEIRKILPLSKSKSEKFKALDQIRKSGVKKELYPLFLEWRKKFGENILMVMLVKAVELKKFAEKENTLPILKEYKTTIEVFIKNWEEESSLSHLNLFHLLHKNLSLFSLLQLMYLSYKSPISSMRWLKGEQTRLLQGIFQTGKSPNKETKKKYGDLLTSQNFYVDFIQSFREFSVNMLSQIVPQEKSREDIKLSIENKIPQEMRDRLIDEASSKKKSYYGYAFSVWEKEKKKC